MEDYDKIKEARQLFYSHYFGILGTLSTEPGLEGFPFGSLTPYSIDRNGNAIILISDIAEHTRNIKADSRVSLTINQAKSGEVQAQGRITYLGNANKITDEDYEEVSKDYLKLFPEASNYFQAHHFYFYRIEFVRARFIGGFGKIFWIEPDDFLFTKPFTPKDEDYIVSHMNKEHKDALATYIKKSYNIETKDGDSIELIRLFHDSCDIRLNTTLYNVWFPEVLKTKDDARKVFVNMI